MFVLEVCYCCKPTSIIKDLYILCTTNYLTTLPSSILTYCEKRNMNPKLQPYFSRAYGLSSVLYIKKIKMFLQKNYSTENTIIIPKNFNLRQINTSLKCILLESFKKALFLCGGVFKYFLLIFFISLHFLIFTLMA